MTQTQPLTPGNGDPALSPTGQGGDMRFGQSLIDPNTGMDPFKTASIQDQQEAISKAATASANTGDPNAAQTSDKAQQLINAGMSQLGVQYVYGAHQWGKALDCSGFTQAAMAQIGINIGGNTYTQVQQGTAVQGGIGNAKPGDLLFTTGDIGMRANGHVALYIGGGKVIAAPHTGTVVQIQDWSHTPLTAIRRYF